MSLVQNLVRSGNFVFNCCASIKRSNYGTIKSSTKKYNNIRIVCVVMNKLATTIKFPVTTEGQSSRLQSTVANSFNINFCLFLLNTQHFIQFVGQTKRIYLIWFGCSLSNNYLTTIVLANLLWKFYQRSLICNHDI